jgi:hypothetical protein
MVFVEPVIIINGWTTVQYFDTRNECKRQIAKSSCRMRDIIKMYFRKTEREGCIQLDQDRIQWQALVNVVMKLEFP